VRIRPASRASLPHTSARAIAPIPTPLPRHFPSGAPFHFLPRSFSRVRGASLSVVAIPAGTSASGRRPTREIAG